MRLLQFSSVDKYTTQFEGLSNRLLRISEKNQLSCFLNRLKDNIRLPVRMLNPANLVATFALAKLQEEYIQSFKRPLRSSTTSFSFGRQYSWGRSGNSSTQQTLLSSFQLALPLKIPSRFPVQRTSTSQMNEQREKGLCYNCHEKWHPGHKCKSPRLYLLSSLELQSDDNVEDVYYDFTDLVDPVPEFDVVECKAPEISLNAISGSLGSKSMRLLGLLHHQRVRILFDSGSTHNFLDPALLSRV
jgi:hypothetical protein